MQLIAYNFFSSLYFLSISLAALFNPKARMWVEGRKDIWKKIESSIKSGEKRTWFHCASLGEFEQGRPLMEALKAEDPGLKIVLTFFSPSGYEIRKNYTGADYIWYLPADSSFSAKKFIKLVNPVSAFFVKYEFWYHYITALKKNKIPVYLVSGIFRPEQIFFKWYGSLFRKILECFTHIFVQNKESFELLGTIGIRNASVSGDTRFDRVSEIEVADKQIPLIEKFKSGNRILVAGSTWSEDEKVLIPFINKSSGIKFILAPHEIGEHRISSLLQGISKKAIRFSKAGEQTIHEYDVLVIDNIGMLSALYRYGEIAYVGGAFTKGLHNILEAAVYGMPVLFGPDHKRFPEAAELIKEGGGVSVLNDKEFSSQMKLLLSDYELLKSKSVSSKNFVKNKTGAVLKIINLIKA